MKFQHDCQKCMFVGTVKMLVEDRSLAGSHGTYHPVDWYICDDGVGDRMSRSIIGRYGDDGPAYWSAPAAVITAAAAQYGSPFMKMAKTIVEAYDCGRGRDIVKEIAVRDRALYRVFESHSHEFENVSAEIAKALTEARQEIDQERGE